MATRRQRQQNEGAVVVRKLPGLKKGKPGRVITSAMRSKLGYSAGDTIGGMAGNFYSPELSTDFLELPQSRDELRQFFRFMYRTNGYVHQALNIYGELPLSAVRLRPPKARNKELAKKCMRFCQRWVDSIDLLQVLTEIVHDLNLIGEVNIFAEDPSPDMPEEVTHERVVFLDEEGEGEETLQERPDASERMVKWLKENYKGWSALRILPPEQVYTQSFPCTDKKIVEFILDTATKDIVNRAFAREEDALEIVADMPDDIVRAVHEGVNVRLNTDPEAGSFIHTLYRKKSQYEVSGISALEPAMRTLVYRDKLRQAQTQIASRHMTPYRLIFAEDMNEDQTDELREQVDLALSDPDYSIVTNFRVEWEERGAEGRLLNLDSEYEITNRELYAALGLNEGLMSGESVYSGDRIHLEVINQRFMQLRLRLQRYVDKMLLAPMCARMGFIEEDEDGFEVIIHPTLSFTRLAVRDSQDTFDILFNLYQKGSLDVETIYEHLNLDADTIREKLERDLWTPMDSTFNELIRAALSRLGDVLVEKTNLAEKISGNLGLDFDPKKGEEAGGRF